MFDPSLLEQKPVAEPPEINTEAELKLEELMQENAALREELTARRAEQQQTYVPKPLDISEYKTRKLYIDAFLEDAGWIEGKNWINEYEIPGMPNKSEVGYADYVLMGDDGRILAVIEAKRTCVDVAKGRQQAKLYADLIEKKQGRRPVVFLTNGFDTRIVDNQYPERKVAAFYSKRDLEKLFNLQSMRSGLKYIVVDKQIAGRYYQEAAIKAVCDAFGQKNRRKALLVMATGSGKTLTSFKTARQASQLPYIDKVLFVVDRKDLDYQTMKEYDRFEKGAANSNTSTAILKKQLEKDDCRIIITTIQKLSTFIKKNPGHDVYQKHVVIIFDECHRSQFGDMHTAIVKSFKKYHLFGFTGTPIFATNTGAVRNPQFFTTEQTFGDQLHTYTIVDAINDKNVLPFRVDYIKTMDTDPDIDDKDVWDIDREKAFMAPERVRLVTKYILDHFDQKTYRGDKTYMFSVLTNIGDVASADRGAVEEIKQKQRVSGFNSIFCVSSVQMAKLYYQEFKKQMAADPTKALRIATIYSYGANEEESDGILDEENSEDTSALDQSSRDFLDAAIKDYNEMFHTNYSTDGDKFQNYYKDVSLRMKNKELDILIVVNMFLTGFDATTLNTLWVDKNLKMHGLIQAFSRTNRILNSIKTFGNIVCFRNLQKRVDDAIALFGDKNASGIVLMQTFKDYYYGYIGPDDKHHPGYVDLMEDLEAKFPLSQPQIIGEQNQKDFIALFGAILRMRNLLSSFDDFAGKELISERDLQDYLGRYQDLRDEWRPKHGDKEDISDDVIFEVELIKQIEINIDYILLLVKKYHDSHCQDKEVLITIRKAVDASPELRSKKALIETFIAGINDVDDVLIEWRYYVSEEREKQLMQIIKEENLNETETRRFLEDSFRNGEVKTTGTDIDKLMPPVSRFGGGNRAAKKQTIIDKLKAFFERFFGIGDSSFAKKDTSSVYKINPEPLPMVAEEPAEYGSEE